MAADLEVYVRGGVLQPDQHEGRGRRLRAVVCLQRQHFHRTHLRFQVKLLDGGQDGNGMPKSVGTNTFNSSIKYIFDAGGPGELG